jgi:hypothetical protein
MDETCPLCTRGRGGGPPARPRSTRPALRRPPAGRAPRAHARQRRWPRRSRRASRLATRRGCGGAPTLGAQHQPRAPLRTKLPRRRGRAPRRAARTRARPRGSRVGPRRARRRRARGSRVRGVPQRARPRGARSRGRARRAERGRGRRGGRRGPARRAPGALRTRRQTPALRPAPRGSVRALRAVRRTAVFLQPHGCI